MLPLQEMGERQVVSDPDLVDIKNQLKELRKKLADQEAITGPNSQKLQKTSKAINGLLDNEVERKIKDCDGILEDLDKVSDELVDLKNLGMKKNKHYKDLIEKAKRKQGKQDPTLEVKLIELEEETPLLDQELLDIDGKLKEQQKKKAEARKVLESILKSPESITPNQIDNLLADLDLIKEKFGNNDQNMRTIDGKIDRKIKDLDKMLTSSDSKKEIIEAINELNLEMDEDCQNVRELLKILPAKTHELKHTL